MRESLAVHENRICIGCGQEFITRNSRSRFCCRKCYKRWQNKTDIDLMRKGNNQTTANGIQKRLDEKGFDFEYLGGWTHTDGRLKLRCRKCGFEFEHSATFTKPSSTEGVRCPECYRVQREAFLTAKREAKEQEAQKKLEAKEQEARKRFEAKILRFFSQDFTQMEMSVCAECGDLFTRQRAIFCSDKCCQKHHDRKKEFARRTRMASQMVDPDITLKQVFEKDKGICYICGTACDFDDHELISGVFKAGKRYPTIEHVVPLSKGGKHAWDNVRCACFSCNSKKGDRLYDAIAEMTS